jgi:Na+/H+ antiporter NhaA
VPTRHPPVEGSWSAGKSPAARRLAVPLREFLDTEVAGGLVLLAATAVALLWANSLRQATYAAIWETELAFEVGRWTLALDLRHWINDGLMALFFFVVGLEIKRELVVGELRSARNAALPVLAALGGMVLPALLFLALLGVGVWLATYASGVHATIAGVALGLLIPTRPLVRHLSVSLGGDDVQPSAPLVRWVRLHVQETISAAERLEHTLRPWTSFAIVPLFALANAVVPLSRAALAAAVSSPVTAGVALGLVAGKLVGISGAAWLALRLRAGTLPIGVTNRQVVAVAAVAGIGFTMSLFIAGLAYPASELQDQGRVGILAGSLLAAALGTLVLRGSLPRRAIPGGIPGKEDR